MKCPKLCIQVERFPSAFLFGTDFTETKINKLGEKTKKTKGAQHEIYDTT
jgi:hypothetical protein